MRKRVWFVLFVSVIAVILLCTSLTYSWLVTGNVVAQANQLMDQPVETPGFITRLQPNPGFRGPFADLLCIGVLIGQPLTDNPDQGSYLASNIVLTLDRRQLNVVPPGYMDLLMAIGRFDSQGKFTTIYGGPLDGCFSVSIEMGLHLANIQIKSTTGKIYSYSWAFYVNSTDSMRYHAAMTATYSALDESYLATVTARAMTKTP